jgi:hypothetical protein
MSGHDERELSALRAWLATAMDEMPSGHELPPEIRAHVLSRLPVTPQRRRWWPFRWFPWGLGATRSTLPAEPHHEGRTKSMFTATRIAAAVAVLALVGSFALVVQPATEDPAPPAAEAASIDPDAFAGFSGTVKCGAGMPGTRTDFDWGTMVTGETYAKCAVETDDDRVTGNSYTIHDYYKYAGQPQYGVRSAAVVLTNEDGTWVTTNGWGYQRPLDGTMLYVNEFRGTGAYDGLSALMVLTQKGWGAWFDVEGVIIPGDLPPTPEAPIEAALATQEGLAAD